MSIDALLETLDGVPFKHQCSTIYKLGIAGDDQLYLSLQKHADFRARWAAVQIARFRKDGSYASRIAAFDTSNRIRAEAYKLAALYGSVEEIKSLAGEVPYKDRCVLVHRLKKSKRIDIVDELLRSIQTSSILEFRQLFYLGSSSFVNNEVDLSHDQWLSGWQWVKFSKHHPVIALRRFLKLVESVGGKPHPFFSRCAKLLISAPGNTDVETSFRILELMTKTHNADALPTRECADLDAARFFEWFRSQSDLEINKIKLTPKFLRKKVDNRSLPSITANDPRLTFLTQWDKVPNPIAEICLSNLGEKWENEKFVLGSPFLKKCRLQHRSAFVNYCLSTIKSDKDKQCEYVCLQEWDIAIETLKTALEKALQPNDVLVELNCFGNLLAHHPDKVEETVSYLLSRCSVQSRQLLFHIFHTLRQVHPKYIPLSSIEQLLTLKESDSDDKHWSEHNEACLLWGRLVPYYPRRLFMKAVEIYWHTGNLTEYKLDHDDLMDIFKQLRSKLSHPKVPDLGQLLCRVIEALGSAIFEHPTEFLHPLFTMELLWKQPEYSQSQVVERLAKIAPRSFAKFAVELVNKDFSWMKMEAVASSITQFNSQLLDKYFDEGYKCSGIRNTEGKLIVLKCSEFYKNLTYKQMRRFTEILMQAADLPREENVYNSVHLDSITELIKLPTTSPQLLEKFIRANRADKQSWMQQAAFSRFSMMDDCSSLDLLLQMVIEEEHHEAVCSLYHAIRRLPQSKAFECLLRLVKCRVGAAKEAVRLLGVRKSSAARDLLLQLFDQKDPPLHGHVRVAIVRALWNYLYDETAWDCLERMVDDADYKVARKVAWITSHDLGVEPHRRLLRLICKVLKRPEEQAARGVMRRLTQSRLCDYEAVLCEQLIDSLIAHKDADFGYPGFCCVLNSCASAVRAEDGSYPLIETVARRLTETEKGVEVLKQYSSQLQYTEMNPHQHRALLNAIIDRVKSFPVLKQLVLCSKSVEDFFQRADMLRQQNELAFIDLIITTDRWSRNEQEQTTNFINSALARHDELYALLAFKHWRSQVDQASNETAVAETLARFEALDYPLVVRAVSKFSPPRKRNRHVKHEHPERIKSSLRHGLPGEDWRRYRRRTKDYY